MDSKKKVAAASFASILLVAAVVAVAVGVNKKDASSGGSGTVSTSTSTKSVQAICAPTDYKDTCEQSLAGANTSDPKELVRTAFQAAVADIKAAIKNSSAYKEAESDTLTRSALGVCEEVLQDSVDDVQRSFDKLGQFSMSQVDDYIEDVKTWLSASIAYHETCIDAFDNTSSHAGDKMKQMLESSSRLLSNGLAMVNSFSSVISGLDLDNFSQRRLLADDANYPSFVDASKRKLMAGSISSLKPNAVVAQDGSGQFKKVSDAVNSIPKKSNQTFVIYVKAGTYKETVIIPKRVNNVVLLGDGPTKTKIINNKNYVDGTPTFHTATLVVNGDDFLAKDIGIENSAGADKHQAVAVRSSGDKSVFYNVQMDGYQDTLYAHTYRQFYRDCVITGTIDFIFGDAAAVFQKCRMVVRKPMENQACMVTAQGRKDKRSVGVTVLQNCDIVADPAFTQLKPAVKAYLGRPWKEYSRTIIMQSNIDGFIVPEGWSPWMGTFALNTLYYGEYQNRGPGSDMSKRVTWKGIQKMTPELAESFTAGRIFAGDEWVRNSGIPYEASMMKV